MGYGVRQTTHRPLGCSRFGFGLFPALAVAGLLLTGGCGTSGAPGPEVPETQGTWVDYTVMTYNVLFALPNPDFDPWPVRREHVAAAIRRFTPDLIGLQEPLPNQVTDLLGLCPEYGAAQIWDTDATTLYRKERFEVRETGTYWLSPTPDVPFSVGFGNFFPRLVIWARLADLQAGREFFLVNTHFDNTTPSQERSAPLFLERTAPLTADSFVIATGDFNSRPPSTAYQTLTLGTSEVGQGAFRLTDSHSISSAQEVVARPGDPTDFDPLSRIDHIFVAGGRFACTAWIVDMTSYGDERQYPSDHFPVVARLRDRVD